MSRVSKIYKLTAPDGSNYIGATSTSLEKRLKQHKIHKDHLKMAKIYEHFDKQGWDNAKMECLETVRYDDKAEVYDKELEYLKLADEKCINLSLIEAHKEHLRDMNLDAKKRYREKYKVEENRRRAERRERAKEREKNISGVE